jgi:hypothetical protein
MREILKRWWQGTYEPPPRDLFMMGHYKLHWSAKAAHVLADFWMKHWQCFSATFATVGLFIAAMKL